MTHPVDQTTRNIIEGRRTARQSLATMRRTGRRAIVLTPTEILRCMPYRVAPRRVAQAADKLLRELF